MADPNSCPNCGAGIDIKNPDKAKMFHCPYCDSFIDLGTQEITKGTHMENRVMPPKSALLLGSEGIINGIKYQVVGRVRYRDTKTYEWWDEWLLLSENGQYLWLQEEDFDFTLMHKYTPKQPFDPNAVGEYVEVDGYKLEVEDNSSASILFFEGELTWKAELGETVRYIDAWKGEDTLYSCEWTDREIMYFIGKDILPAKIYEAFNLGTPPAEAFEEDNEESGSGFQGWVKKLLKGPAFKFALIFGILCFVASFILGFIGVKVPISDNKVVKAGNAYIYGPYKLTRKDRVYLVETKMRLPNNQSLYCEIGILDKDKELMLGWDGDYWFESGRDSEGYWEESNQTKKAYFVLREPGDYYLEITPERPDNDLPGRMKITVKEGVFYTQPLWMMGIFCLIYPGLVLVLYIISNSGESDD